MAEADRLDLEQGDLFGEAERPERGPKHPGLARLLQLPQSERLIKQERARAVARTPRHNAAELAAMELRGEQLDTGGST